MTCPQRQPGRRLRALRALVVAFAVWCCAPGCSLAPKCCGPCPPPVPSEYQSEGAPPPDCSEDLTCWWKQLRDPTLDQLVQMAACQNLSLQEACLRVFEARQQFRVVRGAQLPKLAGTTGYSRKQTSVNANQFIIPQNLQRPFDLYSMGFDTGWEVPLWGKYRNALLAADAEICVSVEKLRDVKVTLLGDVAASYIAYRTLQQRLAIARENLMIQGRTVDLVRARLRAGLVRDLDLAQAQSNFHTTAAQVPPLEEQAQITLNRLAVLLGHPPDRRLTTILGAAALPAPPTELGVGMPAELLRRRPDIRQVEFEVLAAGARIGIAKADLFPQLNLKGTLTADSRFVSNWFTGSSIAYSFGPSVRWDVFNFGRLRANVRVQEQRFQQALVRYQSAVLNALLEVENGVTSFHRQRQRVAELELAVAATREAVRLSQASYQNELVAFQSVLDSQRQLVNLQEQLAQAHGQVVLAAVQTYKAVGGGWNATFDCARSGRLTLADVQQPGYEPPAAPPLPQGSVAPAPEVPAGRPQPESVPAAPAPPPPAPGTPKDEDQLPDPPDEAGADALPLASPGSPLMMNPYLAIFARPEPPRIAPAPPPQQPVVASQPAANEPSAATAYFQRTQGPGFVATPHNAPNPYVAKFTGQPSGLSPQPDAPPQMVGPSPAPQPATPAGPLSSPVPQMARQPRIAR